MLSIPGLNELSSKIFDSPLTPVLKFPQNGSFNFRFIKTVETRQRAKKKNYLCVIFVYLVNQFAYSRRNLHGNYCCSFAIIMFRKFLEMHHLNGDISF